MDEILMRAMETVRAIHGERWWRTMTPGEHTILIYREVRRLDLERSGRTIPASAPIDGPVTESMVNKSAR